MSVRSQQISKHLFTMLQDQDALSFLRENFLHSFVDAIFANHPKYDLLKLDEIRTKSEQLVEGVFDQISKAQKASQNLYSLCVDLNRKNPLFTMWFQEFNDAYENYKLVRKPAKRAAYLHPYFCGSSLVDIGCGRGDLLNFLANEGKTSFTSFTGIDIEDFSDPIERKFEMKVIDLKNKNYQPLEKYDTGLLMSVLHHISEDPKDIEGFLKNIRSLGIKRLIIEEDILLAPEDRNLPIKGIDQIPALMETQPKLKRFGSLKLGSQKSFTSMADFLANALFVGIPEIPFPFAFRSITDWMEMFKDFELEEVNLLGFQPGNFNQVCHALFILNV